MNSLRKCHVIAITNQKGGVGKTTTAMNLACALAIAGKRVLAIDSDPHGNLTQGMGLPVQSLAVSIRDLIVDRTVPTESAIIRNRDGIDVIGANPHLAQAARWMVTQTNAELRLRQRIARLREQYDFVVIDSCPGLGTLLKPTWARRSSGDSRGPRRTRSSGASSAWPPKAGSNAFRSLNARG